MKIREYKGQEAFSKACSVRWRVFERHVWAGDDKTAFVYAGGKF